MPPRPAAARPPAPTAGLVLAAGFGGLLALLAISGLDAVSVLRQIQSRNAAIQRDFLARSRSLEQIRAMLYLSGTYVRDYLLEPDPVKAAGARASLDDTRRQIDSRLAVYGSHLRPDEAPPFGFLRRELAAYWQSLAPVMDWDPRQRRERGYAFLRDQLFPRRTGMLSLADRIAAVNEKQLDFGGRQLALLFMDFRGRLRLTLVATLVLGLLLAVATTRHVLHLQARTAAHLAALGQARQELHELSARLVEVQENERKAIARELHDAAGQSLSAVLLELRNLAAVLPPRPGGLAVHLETIRRLVEATVDQVRNMALLLRPSMLDDLGLVPAVQWQARETARRSGMLVHVAAGEVPEDLPDGHRTAIYRIVQEALANVERHARAREVRITLQAAAGIIRVAVQDDGTGFRRDRERGLGLIGIGERVAHLGGSLQLTTEPGHGTLLAVSLPLPGAALAGKDAAAREHAGEDSVGGDGVGGTGAAGEGAAGAMDEEDARAGGPVDAGEARAR
jgi:signal transduction histidine kinase